MYINARKRYRYSNRRQPALQDLGITLIYFYTYSVLNTIPDIADVAPKYCLKKKIFN